MDDRTETAGSARMPDVEPVPAGSAAPDPTPTYRETLHTPWWWYLAAVCIAAIISAEFHIGGLPVTDWVPYVILCPLSVVLVWLWGRGDIEITDGQVRVRGAHLPLRYCSGIVALDAATLRRVVGREGDPAAFVSIRPWIKPGVQLWVDDADDPTPYWVLSTRHPDRVVALVRTLIDD